MSPREVIKFLRDYADELEMSTKDVMKFLRNYVEELEKNVAKLRELNESLRANAEARKALTDHLNRRD